MVFVCFVELLKILIICFSRAPLLLLCGVPGVKVLGFCGILKPLISGGLSLTHSLTRRLYLTECGTGAVPEAVRENVADANSLCSSCASFFCGMYEIWWHFVTLLISDVIRGCMKLNTEWEFHLFDSVAVNCSFHDEYMAWLEYKQKDKRKITTQFHKDILEYNTVWTKTERHKKLNIQSHKDILEYNSV